MLVVSNHRSFMDTPILMATMKRPIRFACHLHGAVPVMREIVTELAALSLEAQNTGSKAFFPGDSADADFSGGWCFQRDKTMVCNLIK